MEKTRMEVTFAASARDKAHAWELIAPVIEEMWQAAGEFATAGDDASVWQAAVETVVNASDNGELEIPHQLTLGEVVKAVRDKIHQFFDEAADSDQSFEQRQAKESCQGAMASFLKVPCTTTYVDVKAAMREYQDVVDNRPER